jgi:hypothetical protein
MRINADSIQNFLFQRRLLAQQCAVKGAGLQRVKLPPGNWFAPPPLLLQSGGAIFLPAAFGAHRKRLFYSSNLVRPILLTYHCGSGSPQLTTRRGSTMTLQNLLRAVIQQRPSAVRWAYLPVAFVSLLFSLMGWDDGGFSAAWPFVLLLIVCLIQSTYPTLLGWALLLVSCVGYALDVAFSPENGTRGDYVFFLLCGAVPAAVSTPLGSNIRW